MLCALRKWGDAGDLRGEHAHPKIPDQRIPVSCSQSSGYQEAATEHRGDKPHTSSSSCSVEPEPGKLQLFPAEQAWVVLDGCKAGESHLNSSLGPRAPVPPTSAFAIFIYLSER